MIENTLENKAKFFALYLNRKKCIVRQGYINRDNIKPNGVDEYDSLELKPLSSSSITDEDAVEIVRLTEAVETFPLRIDLDKRTAYCRNNVHFLFHHTEVADFLRFQGYLVGWMELTPDEIINYGWAKLKEL